MESGSTTAAGSTTDAAIVYESSDDEAKQSIAKSKELMAKVRAHQKERENIYNQRHRTIGIEI